MSADLQWMCLRNNSSFLVKRKEARRVVMTKEPNNLTGLNTFKYSGLANKRVVGIAGKDARGITVTTRRAINANKPNKSTVSYDITNKCARATMVSLEKSLAGQYYRADLAKDAQRRASAILLSQKPAKALSAKKSRKSKN